MTRLADQIHPRARERTGLDRPAQRSLMEFNRIMHPGYIGGVHIDRLVDVLERVERGELDRVIITIPPRHSKSLNVSELFPAWYLGRNPGKRVIAASHTAALAYTFSRRVRNKISHPLFPFDDVTLADDKAAVTAWDTNHGGGYAAVGVGGTPVGLGGDLISVDDPLRNAADADSPVVRDALWEWYTGTLYTRRQPGAAIIITATRWHEDDLTGRLREEYKAGTGDEWFELHLPAINEDGEALWPEYWPLAELDKARRADSRVWQAQYLGDPTPGTGGTIKRHWLVDYDVLPMTATQIVQSWDTAFETGDSNDWSVCTTWAYGPSGQYLLDVYRERLEFPDLERVALSIYRQYRPSAVLVEDKASGQSLIQSLRRKRVPVIAVPVPPGESKQWRVHEAAPTFEAGWVHLPGMAIWREATIKELIEFPLGKHDDVVDSVVQSVKWIRERMDDTGEWSGSILPRAQDDDEEDEEEYPWHRQQQRR